MTAAALVKRRITLSTLATCCLSLKRVQQLALGCSMAALRAKSCHSGEVAL